MENRPRLVPLSCPQTHSIPSGVPGLPGSALCWGMGSHAPNSTLRIGPVAGSTEKRDATQRELEVRPPNPKTVFSCSRHPEIDPFVYK